MKIYIYTLFSFVSILFSCKKDIGSDKPMLPPDYWGESTASQNGLPWRADPVCWVDLIDHTTLVIELDSFVNNSFLKESLTFQEVPAAVGNYEVFKWTSPDDGKVDIVLSYWEHDVPLGVYHALEGSNNNRLSIESFDTISKEIKGAFDLTLIVVHRPYPTAPDTIRFTNGKFHGRLYDK